LGAGDAFAVGAFGATLLGKNSTTRLSWGTKNAISVIQSFGAQNGQIPLEEIEK
jgi:sugar/nucleoside kinase (ribokinase family)